MNPTLWQTQAAQVAELGMTALELARAAVPASRSGLRESAIATSRSRASGLPPTSLWTWNDPAARRRASAEAACGNPVKDTSEPSCVAKRNDERDPCRRRQRRTLPNADLPRNADPRPQRPPRGGAAAHPHPRRHQVGRRHRAGLLRRRRPRAAAGHARLLRRPAAPLRPRRQAAASCTTSSATSAAARRVQRARPDHDAHVPGVPRGRRPARPPRHAGLRRDLRAALRQRLATASTPATPTWPTSAT